LRAHPIGQALNNHAKENKIELSQPAGFEAIAGHGVRGFVDDTLVTAGTIRVRARSNLPSIRAQKRSKVQ
jgi:Cu+-exporting ATPase